MSKISTSHHTVVVKRIYDAPRARVFGAWRDPAALARWYVPGDDQWTSKVVAHDFRIGGVKQISFGPRGKQTEAIVTDQLVILDGGDAAGDRERGWGETLDRLPAELEHVTH